MVYILIIIFILLIIAWRYAKYRKRNRNVESGEKEVRSLLKKLPSDEYIVLNDIMLETELGTTCQIDHVVLSKYGVFSIETKNYAGLIFGSEYGDEWTQNIYGNKFKLRNPILQNYGHVKTLQKQLGDFGIFPTYSIVTFSSRCELLVNSGDSCVIYYYQLLSEIENHQDVYLDFETVKKMAQCLNEHNESKDKKKVQQHIDKIEENTLQWEMNIENGICPRCGALLTKKVGKYGYFMGCTNYPTCKFTCEFYDE